MILRDYMCFAVPMVKLDYNLMSVRTMNVTEITMVRKCRLLRSMSVFALNHCRGLRIFYLSFIIAE